MQMFIVMTDNNGFKIVYGYYKEGTFHSLLEQCHCESVHVAMRIQKAMNQTFIR